tara:strand:- start:1029 stop:2150 length:1122 start_codon:yes stop_codon:yes gene_type:complete
MSSSPKLDSYNIKLDGFIEAFGPLKDKYSKFGQIFILGAFMGKVLDIAEIEIGEHALGGRHQSTQYEDNVTNILRFVFDYIKKGEAFLEGGTYTSEGKPLSAEEASAESGALDKILTKLKEEESCDIDRIKEWCVSVDFQFVAKGTEDSLSSAAAINRAFGDITAVIDTNPGAQKEGDTSSSSKIYYPINVKMIDSKTKSFNAGSCKQLNYVLFGEISPIQWGPFARRLAIANNQTEEQMDYRLHKDYYYIVYFKDKKGQNTFTSLGQVSQQCITVNPSNPLQLKPPKVKGSSMALIEPIAWMDDNGRDMPKIKEFLLELTEEYFIKLANYLLLYVGDTDDGVQKMIEKHKPYIDKSKKRVDKQSKKIWTKEE